MPDPRVSLECPTPEYPGSEGWGCSKQNHLCMHLFVYCIVVCVTIRYMFYLSCYRPCYIRRVCCVGCEYWHSTNTYAYVRLSLCICICTHIHVHIYMCIHIHIYVYICTHVPVDLFVFFIYSFALPGFSVCAEQDVPKNTTCTPHTYIWHISCLHFDLQFRMFQQTATLSLRGFGGHLAFNLGSSRQTEV